MAKALRVRDRGTVTHRHAADALLERPGDFVLVNRGVPRSLVLACPDGCSETLTINLDPRTDKAWRYYRKRNQLSVFPSVWRDTGCQSHFIIWHHTILWCDGSDDGEEVVVEDEIELCQRVLPLCTNEWQHFTTLAEALEEVPWDVNRACTQLARRGFLNEGERKQRGFFRLTAKE
ncbi:DUF6527 family protein [Paraburkholderia bryophila]|uniref:Uncharacterized protein n=1 Tax=Paraburkholderia bryophila TaxID=420952 RepID=A0A7Y9WNU4_9BURK|nr:hypothetical protein [Paraburkholderia bryophila]